MNNIEELSKPVAYVCDDGDSREYNGHNEFSFGGKGVALYSQEYVDALIAQLEAAQRDRDLHYRVSEKFRIEQEKEGEILIDTMASMREWKLRAEKAEAELSAANEKHIWIKCSDQMPEENDRILIFSDGAFVLLARYVCGEFYDVISNGDEFFETVSRCVSHWMPLPTAPLVEGNADAS